MAIMGEKVCRRILRKSIRALENSLALLDCEVEPQNWPDEEPQEQVDEAVKRADINEDGIVDFYDFAILMEHWLESYETE